MSKISSQNPSSLLLKNKKFYGVIVAPDGQRFRFDISSVSKKLAEEKGEKILEGIETNFDYGKELYEKAEQEKNPFPVTEQFLDCHTDATDSGKSSAVFYLSHEVCRESLDALEVIIYSEESKEEWQEANSSTIKYGRKDEERRNLEKQNNKEAGEYWRGYDKARAEMSEEFEKKRKENSKKGFWKNLWKDFQSN
jgi:hypothetical protein